MPRAVTGAIAEMMPDIATIGGALLGVFAVDEAIKFVEWTKKGIEEAAGLAQAEKDMAEAAKENLKEFANESRAQLQADIQRLNIQLGDVHRDVVHKTRQMENEIALTGPTALILRKVFGDDKDLEDARAKEAQLTSMIKSLEDMLKSESDEANKAAKTKHEGAVQELGDLRAFERATKAFYPWFFKTMGEAGKQIAEDARAQSSAAKTEESNLQAVLALMKDLTLARALSHAQLVQMLPPIEAQAVGIKHLSAAHLELNQIMGVGKGIMKDFGEATAQSTLATIVQGLAAGESFSKVAKAAIGSIAEQAGIQAVWEAAQGLAMEALYFFMPDPRYQASADAHFAAAAIYGGIGGAAAGISAGIHGGGGGSAGGGGGSASSYGRSGGGGGSRGGSGSGAAVPGGGGGGTTIHMYFPGGTLISPDTLPQVMAQMSQLAKGGQATLTASNALTNAEKLT